jgi:ABC-type methionine transport system ATPase subunit
MLSHLTAIYIKQSLGKLSALCGCVVASTGSSCGITYLMGRIQGDKKLRIVFTENSAFEPVIANMILQFGKPVNILRADTKNVGGVAKGEMILGLPDDRHLQIDMEQYLTEHGLEIEEVTGDVE